MHMSFHATLMKRNRIVVNRSGYMIERTEPPSHLMNNAIGHSWTRLLRIWMRSAEVSYLSKLTLPAFIGESVI